MATAFSVTKSASKGTILNDDVDALEGKRERLDAENFAARFGVTIDRLPSECLRLIEAGDFSYRRPEGAERDRIVLDALQRMEADIQKIGAPDRRAAWERGWREAFNEYIDSGSASSKLVPKFIRPNQPIRLDQDYIIPSNRNFELAFLEVLREWIFREFLADVDEVHEFGCGTGFNLTALAKIYPDKSLFGSDFVPTSVELVNRAAADQEIKLTARLFDMTVPNEEYRLGPRAGVFTFGALEQLAGRFDRFLEFLLARRPAICLHLEPTVELYEADNLIDYLAIRFHRKRGYTEGLLPRLRALVAERRIELLRATRLYFGSVMMEGYSLLVWRPVPG